MLTQLFQVILYFLANANRFHLGVDQMSESGFQGYKGAPLWLENKNQRSRPSPNHCSWAPSDLATQPLLRLLLPDPGGLPLQRGQSPETARVPNTWRNTQWLAR